MLIPILIGGALAAGALVVARRPGTFHVERSTVISAPAARAFAEVNDFHNWAHWSPYEKLDPELKRSFSGSSAGQGAVYGWSGNGKAGEGQMTITSSTPPAQIKIRLAFTRPFAAVNEASFSFQPTPEGTRVTWAMDGHNNFGARRRTIFRAPAAPSTSSKAVRTRRTMSTRPQDISCRDPLEKVRMSSIRSPI